MVSIEQLKEVITISRVAAAFNIPITTGHGNQVCPFCGERTFSVRVDVYYKCWRESCKQRGDIVNLLMSAGLAANEKESYAKLLPLYEGPEAKQYEQRTRNLSSVFQAYQRSARKSPPSYLEDRGFRQSVLQYPVGFSPSETCLQEQGFIWDAIVECGLGTKRPGRELFSNRLIFPIYDSNGRLIHLQGRALDPNDELRWLSTTKYTPNISECVFNIHHVRRWKQEYGFVFLCEGLTDCYSLLELGLPAIATFGIQADLVRYRNELEGIRVVALYDNDTFDYGHPQQGQYKSWNAMLPELIRLDLATSLDIRVVVPPARSGVKDVNDLLNYIEWDKDRFLDYCESKMKTLFEMTFEVYERNPAQYALIVEAAKSQRRPDDLEKLRLLLTKDQDWIDFVLTHVRS